MNVQSKPSAASAVDRALSVLAVLAQSSHALRCSFEKGRSVPLHKGASAKCLMAHMSEAALAKVMAASESPPEFQSPLFLQELQQIRQAGYATSSGEVDPGVSGVSVTLFGVHKHAVAALTLMAPSQRAQDAMPQWIQMAVVSAARISRSLRTPH